MRTDIEISTAVRDYLRALAPEPRRRARTALAALPGGDVKPLTDELAGLHRLRVGQHRFVYVQERNRIRVFYAAPRRTVYEFLAAHVHELLG